MDVLNWITLSAQVRPDIPAAQVKVLTVMFPVPEVELEVSNEMKYLPALIP